MKIAVIGSRNFRDVQAVRMFVQARSYADEIISGGAAGVDKAAELAAADCRITRHVYEPLAPRNATRAEYVGALHARNRRIVDVADMVVAFWDGSSPGTKSVIAYAESIGKQVRVIREGESNRACARDVSR